MCKDVKKKGEIMEEKLCMKLKELRKSKKLSQDEVAGYLHVTRQAVSHWETGKTKPDLNCLKKLCELYQISLNEMLELERKETVEVENDRDETVNEKSVNQSIMEILIAAILLALASQVPILGVIVSVAVGIVAWRCDLKGKKIILIFGIIALIISITNTYGVLMYYIAPSAGGGNIEKL